MQVAGRAGAAGPPPAVLCPAYRLSCTSRRDRRGLVLEQVGIHPVHQSQALVCESQAFVECAQALQSVEDLPNLVGGGFCGETNEIGKRVGDFYSSIDPGRPGGTLLANQRVGSG
jgi:hypothetical protein